MGMRAIIRQSIDGARLKSVKYLTASFPLRCYDLRDSAKVLAGLRRQDFDGQSVPESCKPLSRRDLAVWLILAWGML